MTIRYSIMFGLALLCGGLVSCSAAMRNVGFSDVTPTAPPEEAVPIVEAPVVAIPAPTVVVVETAAAPATRSTEASVSSVGTTSEIKHSLEPAEDEVVALAVENEEETLVVTTASPPIRIEVRPPPPRSDHVWVGGHWSYRRGAWVWVPGVHVHTAPPADHHHGHHQGGHSHHRTTSDGNHGGSHGDSGHRRDGAHAGSSGERPRSDGSADRPRSDGSSGRPRDDDRDDRPRPDDRDDRPRSDSSRQRPQADDDDGEDDATSTAARPRD